MKAITNTSSSLRMKLGEAHSTTQPTWATTWAEIVASSTSATAAFTDGTEGDASGTSEVTIVGSPSSGAQRKPQSIVVSNVDSITHTVKIIHHNGTTSRQLYQCSVQSGGTFMWSLGGMAQVYGSDGSLLSTVGTSAALPATQAEVDGDGGGGIHTIAEGSLNSSKFISPLTLRRAQFPIPAPGEYYRAAPRGYVDLATRLSTPWAGAYVVGQHYDNALFGTPTYTTLTGSADQIVMVPFAVSRDFTIDRIGVDVTTGVGSSNCKIAIYDLASSYWPGSKVAESANISTASTGFAYDSLAYTFRTGIHYWLGLRFSSNPAVRAIPADNAVNLGLSGATATAHYTKLVDTKTFATAADSVWSFSSSQLTTGAIPSIRMRGA